MQSAKIAAAPETGRKARKRATRQALKEAARRCLTRDGWHASSVGSFAREAGVAHGTFYVHFPTKESLMDELLAEFNGELAGRLAPILDDRDNPLDERLRRAADSLIRHWTRHRDFVRAYAERLGDGVSIEVLRDGVNPPAERLARGQLERLLQAAGAPARLAALTAQGLLALWLRVGLQAVFNPAVRRSDAVEVLVRMTLGAVSAVAERPALQEVPT